MPTEDEERGGAGLRPGSPHAFGWPGLPGRWTSAQKSGVGTALLGSPVWFTLSHGILNEVYAPRIDQAAIRDLGLIVLGPGGSFSEEKRDAIHTTELLSPGVPAYHITGLAKDGSYRLVKDVITDPLRPVVLQRVVFSPLQGSASAYRLFALLASHIHNHGAGNVAWVADYKGDTGLFAMREDTALCLLADPPFQAQSVGFVGSSDGYQDLSRHRDLHWHFERAENGNVALTGEFDLRSHADTPRVLALGFGRSPEEAAIQARASLAEGFESTLRAYIEPWKHYQRRLFPAPDRNLFALSAMVLRTHASKHIPGALIAGLAVPWGFSRGDGDLGGYHLVWPRDMVESGGGLLAAGDHAAVREAITYLEATQEADGHWLQNMWLEGHPYWEGVQMDETALPILLLDLARREGALLPGDMAERRFWPMVRRAAAFLVTNGPVTQQDRWEEDGGYTPFTLSAEIAALLAAADLAELCGEPALAPYLRETADAWNDRVERWLYVTGTELAAEVGVEGYYVRITAPDIEEGDAFVPIKNRPEAYAKSLASAIVSTDALALVRFGLRRPDDPRIRNTIRVIDTLLKVETPTGPCWRRYNEDGYGEHEDGTPFDGTGIGRAWPLLTGERAHFALAGGNREEALRLLAAMESFAGDGGLLPEQVWDAADIPDRELFFGRPSGSAMPLVWAHAEYMKLVRSLTEERIFDMPPQTRERYLEQGVRSPRVNWRFSNRVRNIPAGQLLRLEVLAPARIRFTTDGWARAQDVETTDSGLGVYYADLPTADLGGGAQVTFTFFWPEAGHWEGEDFTVRIQGDAR